jgi:hypothetical protein
MSSVSTQPTTNVDVRLKKSVSKKSRPEKNRNKNGEYCSSIILLQNMMISMMLLFRSRSLWQQEKFSMIWQIRSMESDNWFCFFIFLSQCLLLFLSVLNCLFGHCHCNSSQKEMSSNIGDAFFNYRDDSGYESDEDEEFEAPHSVSHKGVLTFLPSKLSATRSSGDNTENHPSRKISAFHFFTSPSFWNNNVSNWSKVCWLLLVSSVILFFCYVKKNPERGKKK